MGIFGNMFEGGEEYYVKGLEQASPNVVTIFTSGAYSEEFRVPPECVIELNIKPGDRIKVKTFGDNPFHGSIDWVKNGNNKYKINRS